MRGRILVSLFALPFFSVGVWMLWSISSTLYDAWQMQSWAPVDARIVAAGYRTNSGDSETYEAWAEYRYAFHGVQFTGNRVNISSGGDNIGNYQKATGNRLNNARGQIVTAYVDPDDPRESVIDRDVRWGLMGFKSIFLFVFGGVGLGLLIAVWRAPREKDRTLATYQEAPWFLNDAWQTPTIRSGSFDPYRGHDLRRFRQHGGRPGIPCAGLRICALRYA